MKVNRYRLKNGLRVITIPRPGAKAVTLFAFAGTGSAYESKKVAGVSHFLEHLMFKGTVKRPTPLAVAETIDSIGGVMNAFTGREYTGYFAKVNARHFDTALDWLSDIYLNAKLNEDDISREKGVILEELNMYLDTPMQYVEELWYNLLYDGHPLGQDIIGTRSSIKQMNRRQLLEHRRSYYHAGNTTVVLAGRFDSSSEVIKKISQAFAGLPSGKEQKNPPRLAEKQSRPGIKVRYKKTDQTHFCLGVRGYSLRQPERFPQAVLATLLGGNMSSRLFSLIREKSGLAYYVRTSADTLRDAGFLVTQAGVDNRRIDRAIELIISEYQRTKEELVPEAELQKAKEYLKGVLWLSLEQAENLASYYAQYEVLGLKPMTPEEVCRRIDQVDANSIRRLARNIFQSQNLNLALIGPSRASQFNKILKIT